MFFDCNKECKKKTFAVCPRLPWLHFSGVVEAFFLLRLSFFLSALSCKGRKCMEQDQKHSKACIQAGMRSVQECWHGKESNYPSMNVKKKKGRTRGRERAREWENDETHTHTCARTHIQESQASSFLSSASQRQVCFPGANASHQRAITGVLHSDALQRYRCSGVVGR